MQFSLRSCLPCILSRSSWRFSTKIWCVGVHPNMHPYMPSTSTCSTSLKIYANLAADYQCCMSSTKSVIQCWTWPNPNLNDAASWCFSAIQKYEGGSITSQPINVVRSWGDENIRPYSCMYRSTDCWIDCTGKHVYEVNPFGPLWKRQKGHSFIRHRVTRAWFSLHVQPVKT